MQYRLHNRGRQPDSGADGNVSSIVLPGGDTASFPGLVILYGVGGQTQRTAIRANIPIQPTLAGLKAGKDEVMIRGN